MSYITGLCRSYTDYLIQLDDDNEFEKIGINKGADILINMNKVKECIEGYQGMFLPGGPIANSIHVASFLGSQTGYIGKVANDDTGRSFLTLFQRSGVTFNSKTYGQRDKGSGICIVFVSPDGQRTIAFNRGVVDDIQDSDIDEMKHVLENTDIFFVGLLLRNSSSNSPYVKALKYINDDTRIATSLQSLNEMSKEEVFEVSYIIVDRAEIIFGNECEYIAFLKTLGEKNLNDLAMKFSTKIFVQTLGSKGAVIRKGAEEYLIPAYSAAVVDTTGAGDAFAGGFLHGLSAGENLRKSGEIGAYCASVILSKIGARPEGSIILPKNLRKVV
jgi:fructokinase